MKLNKIAIIIISVIIFTILTTASIFYFLNKNKLNDGIYLSCDKKRNNTKNELDCTIFGVSNNYEVSALSTDIELEKNLELINIDIDSIWKGEGDNGKIVLYTDTNKKGKFNIGKVNLSLKDSTNSTAILSIKNTDFFDNDFNARHIEDKNIKLN